MAAGASEELRVGDAALPANPLAWPEGREVERRGAFHYRRWLEARPLRESAIIQALRGLAAVAVVIFHQRELFAGDNVYVTGVVDHLYLGVDVFFIISGFVIAISTRDEARSDVRTFLIRRLFRVVPLTWVTLFLILLIVHATPTMVVHGLLFFPDIPPDISPVNPPQWTLSYELLFYGLFALALAISHRFRCEICLIVIAALCIPDLIGISHDDDLFILRSSAFLLEFASGVLIGRVALFAPSAIPAMVPAAVATGLVLAGAVVVAVRPIELGFLNFGAGAALILAGVLLAERYFAVWVPRSLLFLGDLSFAIYIGQYFAFVFVDSRVFWTPLYKTWIYQHTSGVSRLSLILAVLFAMSVALHFGVEKPGINLGRRLARRFAAPKRPAAQTPGGRP